MTTVTRLFVFTVIFLTFLIMGRAIAAQTSLFDEANAKYQAGDFKSAAALYEQIIQSSHPTASVYYNLGNARFRLKQKGKALVAYERALRISPRDPDIRWNIDVLKSVLTDRLEKDNDNFIAAWIKDKLALFTADEMNRTILGLLAFLLLVAGAGLAAPNLRPLTRFVQTILIFLLLVVASFFVMKWSAIKDPKVVIVDKEVTARYGPSEKETAAFLLHEGAEARSTDSSRDWIYLTLENNNSGWIRKESCEVV